MADPHSEPFESAEALFAVARRLIGSWCDRRELALLYTMLGGYLALNGLTDGWGDFYEALRRIKALHSAQLPPEEQILLNDLVRAVETIVYRNVPPGAERPRS